MQVFKAINGFRRLSYILIFVLLIENANAKDSDIIIFHEKTLGPSAQLMSIQNESDIKTLSPQVHWRDLDPSYSVDGDIVFSSNRQDKVKVDLKKHYDTFSLFVLNAKSGKVKRIGKERALSISALKIEHDLQPKFHPRKNIIAFIRAKGQVTQSLIIKDLNSGEEHTLLSGKQIHDFSWTPKKSHVFASYETDEKYQLKEFNLKGEVQKTLFSFQKEDALSFLALSVRSSPNGRYVAYIRHPLKTNTVRTAWLLDLKTNRHTRISLDQEQVQAPINWSPKGDALTYSGLLNYRFYYDEKKMKKVYEGGMHLFLHELGKKTKQLTEEDAFHSKPHFSPNGKRLAFLYAEELGDAPMYQLHTLDLSTNKRKILHERVSRQSSVLWVKSKRRS